MDPLGPFGPSGPHVRLWALRIYQYQYLSYTFHYKQSNFGKFLSDFKTNVYYETPLDTYTVSYIYCLSSKKYSMLKLPKSQSENPTFCKLLRKHIVYASKLLIEMCFYCTLRTLCFSPIMRIDRIGHSLGLTPRASGLATATACLPAHRYKLKLISMSENIDHPKQKKQKKRKRFGIPK